MSIVVFTLLLLVKATDSPPIKRFNASRPSTGNSKGIAKLSCSHPMAVWLFLEKTVAGETKKRGCA